MARDARLVDPYRHLYPDNREYTYIPFAAGAMNRSRLDFFLISDSICDVLIDCKIPHSLTSSLFDHKQVTVVLKRHNPYKKQTVNDAILTDPDLVEIVNIASLECYINHLSPSETMSDIEIDNLRLTIGRVCSQYT
jgi:hypothetical protein